MNDCYRSETYRAAKAGDLEKLKELRSRDPPEPWGPDVCSRAARKGHLELLQWALTVGNQFGTAPCDSWTVSRAAQYNQFEVLKWLRSYSEARNLSELWTPEVCGFAAGSGHLHILKWLRSLGGLLGPCPWDEWTCNWAADNGHYEVLKWALEAGCEWKMFNFRNAAAAGNIRIMELALKKGFKWDSWVCAYAAAGGQLETLKWLRSFDVVNEILREMDDRCKNDQLEVVKWLIRSPYTSTAAPLEWSSYKGTVSSDPCPWDTWTCTYAAKFGRLEVLKWLREGRSEGKLYGSIEDFAPCPWDELACAYAAEGGHLEILKWLYSKNAPSNRWTYERAALGGQVEVLKWLYEINPDTGGWTDRVWLYAIRKGHLETVKWLVDTFESPINIGEEALLSGQIKIYEWFQERTVRWIAETVESFSKQKVIEEIIAGE